MITLVPQITQGLGDKFSAREDSYKNTIVKEAYKSLPKGVYPRVVVQEINNSEMLNRSTREGERTTLLSYQITVYTRDTEEFDYVDSARFMAGIVNDYMMETYKIQRIGDMVIQPYISDNTVMTCTQRYTCVYDKETNLIYKN